MTHDTHHESPSGYTIQTAIALVLFILGLMLLVVWAILYANRLSNNLTPEWWIWFFLGFGVGFMVVGLVWLIIVQYMVGTKSAETYERLCNMEQDYDFTHQHRGKHDGNYHEVTHRETSTSKPRTGSPSRRKTSSSSSFAHND